MEALSIVGFWIVVAVLFNLTVQAVWRAIKRNRR